MKIIPFSIEAVPLPVCLFALAVMAPSAAAGNADALKKDPVPLPNVVFLLADDLGVECVGAYGTEAYQTPNLDRLADGGTRFNHCYAGPSCTPSRVALMTGKYNHRNYVNFSMLPAGERTFAHMMKDAGYRTCVVSKWQLGSGHGGVRGSTTESAGFDEACMKQGNTYWNARITTNGEEQAIEEPFYGPDVCADYAVDFVARHADQPFFLYYAFNLPHWDFDATPDSADISSRKEDKNFADMVSYMDKLIGRVVEQLEESGVRENTLIVFSGDNGTASSIQSPWKGEMVRGGKGSRRMDHANVPLIVNWPAKIRAGGVYDDLVDFSDFYPTLADACGRGEKETGLDGRSFLPQTLGERGNPRAWVASYFKGRDRGRNQNAGFFWIGNRKWKLDHTGKLYHVAVDPVESQPIKPADDTPESGAARTKFESALEKLGMDCRHLWVLESVKGGKGANRGKRRVKIYGKPKWQGQ